MLKPSFDLFAPGAVEELITFNRSVFGDLRMEGEPTPEPTPTPAPPVPSPPSAPPVAPAGDKGFPENTPWTDMNVEQQANYWRFQSKKHQERAEARADRDELKAKADELDKLREASQTEQEKAVAAARSEGAQEALRSANERAARAILRSALAERGRTSEQAEALVAATNLASFIADGEVDVTRVTAHVDLVAPRTQTPAVLVPDLGQGRREAKKVTGADAGADLFAQRRKRVAP